MKRRGRFRNADAIPRFPPPRKGGLPAVRFPSWVHRPVPPRAPVRGRLHVRTRPPLGFPGGTDRLSPRPTRAARSREGGRIRGFPTDPEENGGRKRPSNASRASDPMLAPREFRAREEGRPRPRGRAFGRGRDTRAFRIPRERVKGVGSGADAIPRFPPPRKGGLPAVRFPSWVHRPVPPRAPVRGRLHVRTRPPLGFPGGTDRLSPRPTRAARSRGRRPDSRVKKNPPERRVRKNGKKRFTRPASSWFG